MNRPHINTLNAVYQRVLELKEIIVADQATLNAYKAKRPDQLVAIQGRQERINSRFEIVEEIESFLKLMGDQINEAENQQFTRGYNKGQESKTNTNQYPLTARDRETLRLQWNSQQRNKWADHF
jgi:hypothetical protein